MHFSSVVDPGIWGRQILRGEPSAKVGTQQCYHPRCTTTHYHQTIFAMKSHSCALATLQTLGKHETKTRRYFN